MAEVRTGRKLSLKLREKLFLSYSLLSIVILLAAAWVINSQVVGQARRQVREEMNASLPLYDAVWDEQAGRLSALGMAMAGSPIVKTIFGDPRAARDKETIRQMLADFGQELSGNVDLFVVCDGGGVVIFTQGRDPGLGQLKQLPHAQAVAADQKPTHSFGLLGGRLYHLVWTPVVSHSGRADFNATLAILVAGSELQRGMAQELKRRARSDVLFFAGDRLYASSLEPEAEARAAESVVARNVGQNLSEQPTELVIAGESDLAFSRPLRDFDGQLVGYAVVLHSLGDASRLFRAISNRLLLIGTISVVLVLVISYFIARRITRPIEALVAGAGEFGRGNYDYGIDLSPEGEIGQLAEALDSMRRSIKQGQGVLIRNERLATVGQMASGIIHDLRSPLAAISTAADLFADAELSGEKRRILAQSQKRAAGRMRTMLSELLEFSRGKYELKLERRQLAALVEAVVHDTIPPEVALRVAADVRIPKEILVRVDDERIRRMFENLVLNSVQAMPDGGALKIQAVAAGGMVSIHIVDTGRGIPPQLRDRLFEPFVSRGKQGGIGLGLAVARSIAEAHGGSLELVSADGQPADFCVELPIDTEPGPGHDRESGGVSTGAED